MYMRLRCTGMLRHLPLLTFVELTDSKYHMIFLLHLRDYRLLCFRFLDHIDMFVPLGVEYYPGSSIALTGLIYLNWLLEFSAPCKPATIDTTRDLQDSLTFRTN